MEGAGSFTGGAWQEQHFRVTAMFGAKSDDDSVLEVVLDLYRGWSQRRQLLRRAQRSMQDVVRSSQFCLDLCVLFHGIHRRNEYRLSFAQILCSRYQS